MKKADNAKRPSWLLILLSVGVFFFVVSQSMSWLTLQTRRFSIPVEGGPHLSTADDWRSELALLRRDIAEFWRMELESASLKYSAPAIIAPLEGRRSVCAGLARTSAAAYCPGSSTIEINRIHFNTISRGASPGGNHLAIAYFVSRLMARQTQAALGVDLRTLSAASGTERARRELQADCLAGYWLANAPAAYGRLDARSLSRAIRQAPTPPPDISEARAGVLLEDFSLAELDQRAEWALRGFRARHLSECAP